MGIEEDNIRKHATLAYRAPEVEQVTFLLQSYSLIFCSKSYLIFSFLLLLTCMWDLFWKELINEKVDIWALGCLHFQICYFKNAFEGESKLQILHGNYRIPDNVNIAPLLRT